MKGNDQVIDTLNVLLREELTAINQYMVHAEMCDDWGYKRLHELVEKRSIEEMQHASKLIERILFLDGFPIVSQLNEIHIGTSVDKQFHNDRASEVTAIQLYNKGIKQTTELDDNGTRELLESILKDEEAHIDWLESQLDQIEQMGLKNYLVEQID